MDRLAKLVALACLALGASAHAGYAQLAPPPGWTAGTGPGGLYGAAANSGSWSQGIARASGALNVGGRTVAMPVAMRLASNAPQYLATRIGAGWALGGVAGPLGLGLTIGAALLLPEITQWISSSNRVRWNPDEKRWEKKIDGGGVDQWVPDRGPNSGTKYGSAQEACMALMPPFVLTAVPFGNFMQCTHANGNVLGDAIKVPNSGGGGARYEPADYPTEVKPEIEKTPFPEPARMPEILPGIWPIELPSINPGPAPDYAPQPLIIPQGDPVVVPNSNPRRWTQPEIQVTPAPSTDSPFRVDIRPQDRPVPDPSITPPRRDPYTLPNSNPDPNAPTNPDGTATPTPKEADLCEKHPDILACAKFKLGEIEPEKIKNTEVPLKLDKESGFPSGGQCPAAKVVPLMGKSFSFTVEPLCDFAKAIKPLLIGFAYLTAALTFLGVARRE